MLQKKCTNFKYIETRAMKQSREYYTRICRILANTGFPHLSNFLTFKPQETAELLGILI